MNIFGARALAAVALLAIAGLVQAKSTTAVAISYDGKPTPGKVTNFKVTLTGKHFVYAGNCTFYSGEVYLYQGDNIVVGDYPTTLNSNVVDQQVIYVPPDAGGCYDSNSGMYYAVKVYGDHTELTFPYQLPAGAADYTFYARFDGDPDANGSTSQTITVPARYPSMAPIIDLLLD